MRIAALIGPESTGKTSFSKRASIEFGAPYIAELARGLLEHKGGQFNHSDIEEIYRTTKLAINAHRDAGTKQIIMDTDLIQTRAWEVIEWGIDISLPNNYGRFKPDIYFLFSPDVPWKFDGQRRKEAERNNFFNVCLELTESVGAETIIVTGGWEQRWAGFSTELYKFLEPNKIYKGDL